MMWEEQVERGLAFVIVAVSAMLLFMPNINHGFAVLAALTALAVFFRLSSSLSTIKNMRGMFQIFRYLFVAWLAIATVQQMAMTAFPDAANSQIVGALNDMLWARTHGFPDLPIDEVERSPHFMSAPSFVVHGWSKSIAYSSPLDAIAKEVAKRASSPIEHMLDMTGEILLLAAVMLRFLGRVLPQIVRPY